MKVRELAAWLSTLSPEEDMHALIDPAGVCYMSGNGVLAGTVHGATIAAAGDGPERNFVLVGGSRESWAERLAGPGSMIFEAEDLIAGLRRAREAARSDAERG